MGEAGVGTLGTVVVVIVVVIPGSMKNLGDFSTPDYMCLYRDYSGLLALNQYSLLSPLGPLKQWNLGIMWLHAPSCMFHKIGSLQNLSSNLS